MRRSASVALCTATSLMILGIGVSQVTAAPVPSATNGELSFSRGQSYGWGDISTPFRINVVAEPWTTAKAITNGGDNPKNSDLHPAYSWDGSKIAFSRKYFSQAGDGSEADIYVANADGTKAKKLTSGGGYKSNPRFTSDGEKVVFASTNDGDNELYSIGVDGTGLKQLTSNSVSDLDPSLDAEGRIYFTRQEGQKFSDIYRMDGDGKNLIQLTDSPKTDEQPSVSRDGKMVSFVSTRDGNFEIYSMKADGSGETRLTNNKGSDRCPEMSPDGKEIAFCTNRYSNDPWGYDVAVMNSNGAGPVHQITKKATTDVEPSWRPVVEYQGPVFQFNPPQAPPQVLSTFPLSPNSSLTPKIKGLTAPGTNVMLFTTGDCSGDPVVSGSAGNFNSGGLQVEVAPGSTTTFRAIAINAQNVYSVCSPTSVTYHQEDPLSEK